MKTFKQFLTENSIFPINFNIIKDVITDYGFKHTYNNTYIKRFSNGVPFYLDILNSQEVIFTYYIPGDEPIERDRDVYNMEELREVRKSIETYEIWANSNQLTDNKIINNVFNKEYILGYVGWDLMYELLDNKLAVRDLVYDSTDPVTVNIKWVPYLPKEIKGTLNLSSEEEHATVRSLPYIHTIANLYTVKSTGSNIVIFSKEEVLQEMERRDVVKNTDKDATDLFGDIFDM